MKSRLIKFLCILLLCVMTTNALWETIAYAMSFCSDDIVSIINDDTNIDDTNIDDTIVDDTIVDDTIVDDTIVDNDTISVNNITEETEFRKNKKLMPINYYDLYCNFFPAEKVGDDYYVRGLKLRKNKISPDSDYCEWDYDVESDDYKEYQKAAIDDFKAMVDENKTWILGTVYDCCMLDSDEKPRPTKDGKYAYVPFWVKDGHMNAYQDSYLFWDNNLTEWDSEKQQMNAKIALYEAATDVGWVQTNLWVNALGSSLNDNTEYYTASGLGLPGSIWVTEIEGEKKTIRTWYSIVRKGFTNSRSVKGDKEIGEITFYYTIQMTKNGENKNDEDAPLNEEMIAYAKSIFPDAFMGKGGYDVNGFYWRSDCLYIPYKPRIEMNEEMLRLYNQAYKLWCESEKKTYKPYSQYPYNRDYLPPSNGDGSDDPSSEDIDNTPTGYDDTIVNIIGGKITKSEAAKSKADGKTYKVIQSKDDKKIASINNKGIIQGKKEGTADIEVQKADKTYKYKVAVFKPTFNKKLSMYVDDEDPMYAGIFVKNKGKNIAGTEKLPVKYTIKKTKNPVITLSENGLAYPAGKGTTTVTTVCNGKKFNTSIRVYAPEIVLNKTNTVIVGKNLKAKAKDFIPCKGQDIWWSLKPGDEKYADIDMSGKITAIAPGKVTVIAEFNGKEISKELTIVEASVK